MNDIKNATAAFIMPFWAKGNPLAYGHLKEAIDSLFQQTDQNWTLIFVDDGGAEPHILTYMERLQASHPGKFKLLLNKSNKGAGHARNLGVQAAYEQGIPFFLYLDSDDCAHPLRLEKVREIFAQDPKTSVVYSPFQVIDEYSLPFPEDQLTPSIVEIIDCFDNPPQGENAWIDIGTVTGYATLTSATSARTELAHRFPFPNYRASEDSHAWMRYSAGGDKFVFVKETPTRYRVPLTSEGSASRTREGGKYNYYHLACRVDTEGFQQAMELAIQKNKIAPSQQDWLMVRFYVKLAETMAKERQFEIAAEQLTNAARISPDMTRQDLQRRGLDTEAWAVMVNGHRESVG
jgi:hypothetical protein